MSKNLKKNRMFKNMITILSFMVIMFMALHTSCAQESIEWLHFKPNTTNSKDKKIVLISGDDEYRSEESLPMLAKILTEHHGFECVVLFAIDPITKQIKPDYQKNIPGLHHLEDADVMILALRFRDLPDHQMKYIDNFLKEGKSVIGLRTSTHAFNFPKDSKSSYSYYGYNTKDGGWVGGFGKLVLGETWVNHHGDHGTEGTRAFVNGLETKQLHPILQGVKDIWGPSDVYGIQNKLQGSSILLFGQPTKGMVESSPVNIEKSIMPIAWTRNYMIPSGKKGKAFTTTMGASIDFISQDLRRLIVNACYWAVNSQDRIDLTLNVDIIGEYNPSMFGFGTYTKGKYPNDYR